MVYLHVSACLSVCLSARDLLKASGLQQHGRSQCFVLAAIMLLPRRSSQPITRHRPRHRRGQRLGAQQLP